MYGVIGEDPSDVETLKVLIRRLANNEKLPVFVKGYSGCGEMLRKGASQLKLFAGKGVVRFVVCYDADRGNPVARELEARQKVWDKALADGIHGECCIVVPIQELEAWILADLSSVSKVITSWTPKDVSSPELINDPKEHLERLSRQHQKPKYIHAVHNQKIAFHLDLAKVAAKCGSFVPLMEFVTN
ncbi:MAG: DUF4276 family protein [Azonexus sp.]|nr:DUF4276 family protein [Azonexus sp.]MBP6202027.1 DUF4276 family protein [Azonexus sp.]